MFHRAVSFLRNIARREQDELEITAELKAYLELLIEEKVRSAMRPDEAERVARIELGGSEQVKEQVRNARAGASLESVLRDLRYGARTLRKSPGFAAVTLLTIALGIAANTAVFSIVNAVLLHPLPYKDASRLVWVTYSTPLAVWKDLLLDTDYFAWRGRNQVFEDMAANGGASTQTLTGAGEPERVNTNEVSANFFQFLGIQPKMGRGFLPEEARRGGTPVAVISDSLWRQRFSGEPNVVGRSITLDGNSYTVVGVLPSGFEFPELNQPDVLLPLRIADHEPTKGFSVVANALARLRPGVSVARAVANLEGINVVLRPDHPPTVAALMAGGHPVVIPLQAHLVGDNRFPLLVLMCAVGFVLLIACANVANLQLARASIREREIALRSALGATPKTLALQLLTESCTLAFAGGTISLLLAAWLIAMIRSFGPQNVPHLRDARLDLGVLLFTLLLSLLAGVLFGLAPILMTRHLHLSTPLKESQTGAGSSARTRRPQKLLAIAEVALALVLFVGATLLVRTLQNLISIPPGFDPHHVLTIRISLPISVYKTNGQDDAFFRELLNHLQTLPAVTATGAASVLPYRSAGSGVPVTIEGRAPLSNEVSPHPLLNNVTPGYFSTLRVPLLTGRFLDTKDWNDSIQSTKNTLGDYIHLPSAVVINEAFAHRYFPNENPLQKRLRIGLETDHGAWQTIVGVVGNVQQHLAVEPEPECFFPWPGNRMDVIIRAASDPTVLMSAIREQVSAVDRNVPIDAVETMDSILSSEMAARRFSAWMLSAFAAVAVLLAAVGIYGIMAYAVSQRTREIGVRIALGAESTSVLRQILAQGLGLALSGVAIGLAVSFALTRVMKSMLYGVTPNDPTTFAIVTGVLVAVAIAACYIPARRAMRVDPLVALRHE
jgi:putative ABC transport system permease protein